MFAITLVGQAKTLEQVLGPAPGFPRCNAKVFRLINEKLVNGQKRIKIRFLGAKADKPAAIEVFRGDIMPKDLHVTALIIG